MFEFFESLSNLIRLDRVCIDNAVFRLHYKLTVLLLVACSLLVTGKEYFGDPIDCIYPDDNDEDQFLDTYCWIHSTFTLPDAFNKQVGINGVAAPGVDKYTPGAQRTYHKYYQWVCFALFFQAIGFYFPR